MNSDRHQTSRCEVERKNAPLLNLYPWHAFGKCLTNMTSEFSIITHLLVYRLTFSHVQHVSAANFPQRGSIIKMGGENYVV